MAWSIIYLVAVGGYNKIIQPAVIFTVITTREIEFNII
jgi:hypothetical protein